MVRVYVIVSMKKPGKRRRRFSVTFLEVSGNGNAVDILNDRVNGLRGTIVLKQSVVDVNAEIEMIYECENY
jgi:hypothetical protein